MENLNKNVDMKKLKTMTCLQTADSAASRLTVCSCLQMASESLRLELVIP